MVLLGAHIPLDIDSDMEETEELAAKEADEDGTYIFTFWINSDDPELQMTHDFDSGDTHEDEPYEEVQFKIPLLWRPEPEGGGRKKKRKTKKRRR